jgi:hypothetical protein
MKITNKKVMTMTMIVNKEEKTTMAIGTQQL